MDKFITSAAIATVANSALKGAKAPAQFLDDVMELVGFGHFNYLANKKRSEREQNLLDYKNKIASGLNDIAPENVQLPKLSVVGPALESSKFYIEEEELRNMFSKLVIASADSSKNGKVHESFVEIIKQLSTDDAKHLVQIQETGNNPLISFKKKNKGEISASLIKRNHFLSNHLSEADHEIISASLINLQRLGLIKILNDAYYSEEIHYEKLYNSQMYSEIETKLANSVEYELDIEKGVVELTSFGQNFCYICL